MGRPPKQYVSDIPELMAEWNWEKNNKFGLDPHKTAAGTKKHVWWKCSKGHEWNANPNSRSRGSNCPYCSNRKILPGYNDLKSQYPKLADEWNYERNSISPEQVLYGSIRKVWWKCSKGHEWEATVCHRSHGRNCPYCAHKYPSVTLNDLTITHPELVTEWNFDKNVISPQQVSAGSGKKVWWRCSNGHEWEMKVCDRTTKKNGCPYCSNHRVLKGYNDLQTVNPMLANEWNYKNNNGLNPQDVMQHSGKTVWWKCSYGHEWQAQINSRSKGHGCPYCAGQKPIVGENDLCTTSPNLVKEWNYTKNGELLPEQFMRGSSKTIWWICKHGHEWKASIACRTNGTGCPHCSHHGTSLLELILLYCIRMHSDTEVIHRHKIKRYEIDIFIPSLNVGIEYDGYWFHKDKVQHDLRKNEMLHKHNITLYRIREQPLPVLNSTSKDISYQYNRNLKEFEQVIAELIFRIFNKKVYSDFETYKHQLNNFDEMLKLCGY